MKKSIKQASQWLITLCLALLMAGGSFIDSMADQHLGLCQAESINFPNHFEHSHSHASADLLFVCSALLQCSLSQVHVTTVPPLPTLFVGHYTPSIWQPPQL